MLTSQKLQRRSSEIRARLQTIASLKGDALTAEIRTESDKLTNEFTDVETQMRAALTAEGTDGQDVTETVDAEERERRTLARAARVGAFIESAITGKPIEGRERELSDAFKCNGPASAGRVRRGPPRGPGHHSGRDRRADGGADRAVRVRAFGRGVARVPVPDGRQRAGKLPGRVDRRAGRVGQQGCGRAGHGGRVPAGHAGAEAGRRAIRDPRGGSRHLPGHGPGAT